MKPSPTIVPHQPGEEPNSKRALLENIHRRAGDFPGVRGVLDPRIVDRMAFVATVVSIVVCSTVLLAIVWGGIASAQGLKVIGSVLIVLFAILTFRSVNRSFGE